MKLKIPALHKTIKVNNKTVKIPKLGIKHYGLLSNLKSEPVETITAILKNIDGKLTNAESEFVLLHLLVFNKLLPEVTDMNGFEYDLNNAYICNQTVFMLDGKEYKFRQPRFGQLFDGYIDTLNTLSKDGVDFGTMPASVLKWVESLTATICIDTPEGKVKGFTRIAGIM